MPRKRSREAYEDADKATQSEVIETVSVSTSTTTKSPVSSSGTQTAERLIQTFRPTKKQRFGRFVKAAAYASLWMAVGSTATLVGLASLGDDA